MGTSTLGTIVMSPEHDASMRDSRTCVIV